MTSGKLAGGGGVAAILMVIVSLVALGPGCTPLGLNTASRSLEGVSEVPAAVLGTFDQSGPVTDPVDWSERREDLLQAFQDNIYGPYPKGVTGELISREVLDDDFHEVGRLEELTVGLGEGHEAVRFKIALALPATATDESPAPLIIAQNFCGNDLAMNHPSVSPPIGDAGGCGDNPVLGAVVKIVFGQHIMSPPVDEILDRGYAIALVFPSETAPDRSQQAPAALERLSLLTTEKPEGVLAVWAATFGWSIDAMQDDPRIAQDRIIAWGHSRHGKAALIAGAFEPRIAGVISHQSGTGGATLNVSHNGESLERITGSYPHWFAPSYAEYAGREEDLPVDQHQLIALNAPKPVFLGNGWKDVWSDPNGTFRAAMAADPAYELLGVEGLAQTGLADPDYLSGEIAFQIRTGGHGVRRADWRAFLDWMDVWFPSSPGPED